MIYTLKIKQIIKMTNNSNFVRKFKQIRYPTTIICDSVTFSKNKLGFHMGN